MSESVVRFLRKPWAARRPAMAASLLLAVGISQVALADVCVIVSAKSGKAAITSDEVSQIYLGRSTSLKPIDNNEDSPIRAQFYSKVVGRDEAQAKAIWSRLVFTGKATAPKKLASSADVVKAVASDSSAIGYVDTSAVNSSVKVVMELK